MARNATKTKRSSSDAAERMGTIYTVCKDVKQADGTEQPTQLGTSFVGVDGTGHATWVDSWSRDDVMAICPLCGAFAVTPLTERLLKLQPDETTHVCHPGFGGCNHGFTID